MPSTVEKLSPTRAKLVVEIPFNELAPQIETAYKQISQQVNVPGFRRGHVPKALIDQRYGRATVLQDAINEALPGAYSAAIAEHGLAVLGQPEIDITKLEDGEVVEFSAEVDIRPDFEIADLSKITVSVDPVLVSQADLEERVRLLRERFAEYTDLDTPAAPGDVVIIDLAASQHGEALPEADAAGMIYTVGEGGMVDGLDQAVTGLSAGQSATFATELAGGPHRGEAAEITVTVQKVQERTLPPLDDEFAQMVSEYDTAEQMRGALLDNLERLSRLDQASQARDKVLDAVIDATPFELPGKLLDDEVESRRASITDQLAQAGLTIEDYLATNPEEEADKPEAFWEKLAEQATRALRTQILLDKMAEDLAIGVTQEDLRSFILQRAQSNGTTPDEETKHMVDHNHTAEWIGEIRRGKALGAMVAKARVTDSAGAVVDLARLRGDGTLAPEQTPGASADGRETVTVKVPAKKGSKKAKSSDAGATD